ncbi:MAG TPA: hypothetical protein PKU91_06925 [Phycisphaerales bacterium]|nr:hypothetical protein [Phycisphaerales bacterium]
MRNTALVLELLAVGPLAGGAVTFLRASDGGLAVTPLLNNSPVLGLVVGVFVILAAAAVGMIDTRYFGPRSGIVGAGIVFAWASLYSGRVDDLLRTTAPSQVTIMLAIEGVLAAVVMVLLTHRLTLVRWAESPPDNSTASRRSMVPRGLFTPGALACVAAAAVAGGFMAWLVTFHAAKGQAVFGASAAGIAAGALAAIVSANTTAGRKDPPVDPVLTAMLGMGVLAMVSPVTISMLHSDPLASIRTGSLFRLGLLNSFDWMAGAMIGIPIGLGWAGAHTHSPARQAPSSAV